MRERRRNRTRRSRKNQDKGKPFLANQNWFTLPRCTAIAAIIVLGSAFFGLQAVRPDAVGNSDYCSLNRQETGITVLLIDVSDKLRANQILRLKNEMEHVTSQPNNQESYLAKGEKMVVYFLDEEDIEPSKEFEMCNPGDVENRGVEALFEGTRIATFKWEEFTDKLLKSIDDKVSPDKPLNTSPILEGIETIREEFPPPRFLKEGKNYRIQIWSDMLQNSRRGNHFGKMEDVEIALRETSVDLEGISVTIYQILSEKYGKYQDDNHLDWWQQFFKKTNSALQIWKSI